MRGYDIQYAISMIAVGVAFAFGDTIGTVVIAAVVLYLCGRFALTRHRRKRSTDTRVGE